MNNENEKKMENKAEIKTDKETETETETLIEHKEDDNQDQDQQSKEPTHPTIKSFDELDISTELLRGIYGYGFEIPSEIQSTAILPMVEKKNLIAQAQSGTGKTGAFTIGALSRVDPEISETQVLLLAPTRELAQQSANVVSKIGAMIPDLHVKLLIGGNALRDDLREIERTLPHVVVGTPGRIFDVIRRRYLELTGLRLIVLDEADEMLSFGFEEQIQNIFQMMPTDTTIALFSATMPPNIIRISNQFMKDPVSIRVALDKLSLDGIKQFHVELENDHQKYATLMDLYQNISVAQCIIYCNSVQRVDTLAVAMRKDSFPVSCIHGRMNRQEREEAFQAFKNGESRVLISSDITARGIDVQQVNMVINFDVPTNMHNYLHRIGRSGRWGRKGTAINFATKRDMHLIHDIEKYYTCKIEALTEEALGRP